MLIFIVLAAGLTAGAMLVGLRSATSDGEMLDIERQEQWLIVHLPSRLAGPLRSLDRRFVGGAMVCSSFVVLFAASLAVGWIFSGIEDDSGIARWDVAAAEWGRDNATDASTTVLDAVTDLGGTILLIVVMVSIGVYHSVRRDDHGPGVYLAIVGVGVSAVNNGLKLIVDRDRPDIAQLAGYAGSSFPSGHSAAAAACWAAIALVVARHASRRVRLIAGTLATMIAAAVAASRVLLGVHWLSDVVAGVVVGWTWFGLVTIAVGGRSLRLGEPAERVARSAHAPIERQMFRDTDRREESST